MSTTAQIKAATDDELLEGALGRGSATTQPPASTPALVANGAGTESHPMDEDSDEDADEHDPSVRWGTWNSSSATAAVSTQNEMERDMPAAKAQQREQDVKAKRALAAREQQRRSPPGSKSTNTKKSKAEKRKTNEERRGRLRTKGYYRFIDKGNEEMRRRISKRLPCKKLPKLLKEVIVQEYKAELGAAEARRLHRPQVVLNPEVPLEIGTNTVSGGKNTVEGGTPQTKRKPKWTRADISGSAGAVCLFEYMEERPPLLCNVGMASKLCNFYQADTPTDKTFVPPGAPDNGRTVVLQPDDGSPFFATLREKEIRPAIVNDLIVAPVAEHTVSKTDFLLVRPNRRPVEGAKGKSGPKEAVYIRNVKALYLVGQTEPRREVFHPSAAKKQTDQSTYNRTHERESNERDFLERFVDFQVIQRFKREEPKTAIPTKKLQSMFTVINRNIVNASLRRVTKKSRLMSTLKQNEATNVDDLCREISGPGMCQYESLQAGLQRLRDQNIELNCECEVTRVMHAQAILMDFYHLKERAGFALKEAVFSGGTAGVVPGPQYEREIARKHNVLSPTAQKELRAAQFIVDELQLSPWYLTQSYINQKQAEQPRFKLGRGEAIISYLPKDPVQNEFSCPMNAGAEDDALSAAKSTAADDEKRKLSSITKKEAEKILTKLGHAKEIRLLKKADWMILIEDSASAFAGSNKDLAKFARRRPRRTEKDIREEREMQKGVNAYFEEQVKAISQRKPPDYECKYEQRDPKPKAQPAKSEEEEDLKLFSRKLHGTNHNEEREAAEERARLLQIRHLPGQPPLKGQKVVRRTVIRKLPNGKIEAPVEYIKTPEVVSKVREESDKRETPVKNSKHPERSRAAASPQTSGKDQIEGCYELEEYQANIRKFGKNWPLEVKGRSNRRCRACGLPDHTSNSIKCPLRDIILKDNPQVKTQDFKVTVSRAPTGHASQQTGVKGSSPQENKRQRNAKEVPSKSAKRRKHGRSRRTSRRTGPIADLRNDLQRVWRGLFDMPEAAEFRTKVDKRTPRYYDIITKPMHLGKIKRSLDNLQYTSRDAFMDDLVLMRENAATFNGEDHEITRNARKLVLAAKESLVKDPEETIIGSQSGRFSSTSDPSPSPLSQTAEMTSTPALSPDFENSMIIVEEEEEEEELHF